MTDLVNEFASMTLQDQSGGHKSYPARQQLRAAFLVRCWFEDGAWRYSLESITTRRRHSYLSLEMVLEGIASELSASNPDET